MPLIKILGISTAVMLVANIVQCGRSGTLQERIGEERQKCETSFAKAETEYQKELTRVKTEMANASATAVAALVDELNASRDAKNEVDTARRETEARLVVLMDRLNEEDQEWADVFIPAYLLSP